MNNNPRHVRPAMRGAHLNNGPRFGNNRSPQPRPPINTAFAKPPSQSRAPWDITQWVDPVQAKNPKMTK